MRIVFISNARIQDSCDITVDRSLAIRDIPLNDEHKVGDCIFVIDVHCTFRGAEKMQEQGGVIIYRQLLSQFKDCQDKLKVIFYSPIPAGQLASLRPENQVLKLLPFIELNPSDSQGNYVEGWNFEDALRSKIQEANFSQFNNASENLLSGWALTGAEKIDLKGKRLLVIDDEWRQWSVAYGAMLEGSVDYFLHGSADIKAEFMRLGDNSFSHLPQGSLAQYDFIISDMYLWENHETDKWKTEDFIRSVSGFLLFKLIRDVEPSMPVIFHTTSGKFRIYKALSTLGADGQVLKNISCRVLPEDKEENYKLFEQLITGAVEDYGDSWLNEFYRYVSDDKFLSHKFLRRRTDEEKKEVIDLVKHAILGYKNLKVNNEEYLDSYFVGREIDPASVPASGVLTVLGKIQEALGNTTNPELLFLYYLRNQAAHVTNYHLYSLDDVKIALGLLFKSLRACPKRSIPKFKIPQGSKNQPHKYAHQIFYYAHYYNNWSEFIPDELRAIFIKRLSHYIDDYHKKNWLTFDRDMKGKVTNEIEFIRIDPSIASGYEIDLTTNKLSVRFKP